MHLTSTCKTYKSIILLQHEAINVFQMHQTYLLPHQYLHPKDICTKYWVLSSRKIQRAV